MQTHTLTPWGRTLRLTDRKLRLTACHIRIFTEHRWDNNLDMGLLKNKQHYKQLKSWISGIVSQLSIISSICGLGWAKTVPEQKSYIKFTMVYFSSAVEALLARNISKWVIWHCGLCRFSCVSQRPHTQGPVWAAWTRPTSSVFWAGARAGPPLPPDRCWPGSPLQSGTASLHNGIF